MTPKQRVFAVLTHQRPDRMPCFGANSTATYEQMETSGAFWPEAHEKADAMARLALAAHTDLGFDAVRVPFCQTFEAEAFGCRVKSGGTEGIPGIAHQPPLYSLDDPPVFPEDFLERGRIPELLQAVRLLKAELGDRVPVIGGIVGPLTVAGSLLDIAPMLMATYKSPEKLRPFLEAGEKAGTLLAGALIEAGADIIACEDMSASPEIIAPKTYQEYELGYQQKQFGAVPVPKILHICGRVDHIIEWMGQTGADVLSLEPRVDLANVRAKCGPDMVLMGGVETASTLFMADTAAVRRESQAAIAGGVQILAPGCAVAPGTPTENLRAMAAVAHSLQ